MCARVCARVCVCVCVCDEVWYISECFWTVHSTFTLEDGLISCTRVVAHSQTTISSCLFVSSSNKGGNIAVTK